MANSSARRPPADILKQTHSVATQQQQPSSSSCYLSQKNGLAPPNAPCAPTPPAATSKAASRPSAPLAAELVRPHYKGHQRRQSVARLLPDISKLRLLSWLVEASNELINCDIAIMDGVYAKLNHSRESLLFWQQAAAAAAAAASSSRAPAAGAAPSPPSVQPVGNKTVISKRHKQLAKNSAQSSAASPDANQQRLISARNKLLNEKLFSRTAPAANSSSGRDGNQASRNHHSLPLTNYDSSSLAAISMRSSLSNQTNDSDSIAGSIRSQPPPSTTNSVPLAASNSIEATIELMMQQNSQRKQSALKAAAAVGATGQPTSGARNNSSLPIRLAAAAAALNTTEPANDFGEVSSRLQSDDEDVDDEDDDDGNSSATSSTTSSGIHGASSSSAVSSTCSSSSSSSCASSSLDSNCPFDGTNRVPVAAGCSTGSPASAAAAAATTTTSAEQLSERIRRAVMEHNYLQNLLVNVIRHHDRQRELHKQELIVHKSQQSTKLDAYGRPLASQSATGSDCELPRIDLASIAEALDDGCQCSCHNHRPSTKYGALAANPPPRPPPPTSNKAKVSVSIASNSKASTLPTSSSLSLFQSASLVPSRKNRPKKSGAGAPSREDLIQKLADKLCENCFETHYWLQSCVAIETPNDSVGLREHHEHKQTQSTTNETIDMKVNQNADPNDSLNDQQPAVNGAPSGVGSPLAGSLASSTSATAKTDCNLDSIVSLRNATFIRLVQQQVRATISNSIELIDLIRREIKSPESIKQKQLMRCFSASIQLLSSVAGYVVPSQDISTFIPTEMVPGNGSRENNFRLSGAAGNINRQQQTNTSTLFSLPPSDFDHLLLYPHRHSNSNRQQNAGLCESFLVNHNNRQHAYQAGQQQQANNYHLAQAPEIPIRRRDNQRPPAQRRSFDEVCTPDGLQQQPRIHLLSQQFGLDRGSFRSLPPNVMASSTITTSNDSHRLSNDTLVAVPITATNPNGDNIESSSGASSNNSSASSSIARGQVQQSSLKAQSMNSSFVLDGKKTSQDLSSKFRSSANSLQRHNDENNHPHHHHLQLHHSTPTRDIDDLVLFQQSNRAKFWQSSKFNFIKKLLQVKQQRLLRQQSKDRRIYNNKVANKFRLVMMDLTHFNKSQQLLTTENGVNSLLTSMRNVLEFGLYLTVKLY